MAAAPGTYLFEHMHSQDSCGVVAVLLGLWALTLIVLFSYKEIMIY